MPYQGLNHGVLSRRGAEEAHRVKCRVKWVGERWGAGRREGVMAGRQ